MHALFYAAEHSLEAGLLGRSFLGVPVYGWLLILLAAATTLWLLHRRRRTIVPILALLFLCGAALLQPASSPLFRPDDPIRVDPDRLPLPPPGPIRASDAYDFLVNVLGLPDAENGPALNANTLGEVPRSSWFTPRELDSAQVAAGPDSRDGPSREGPWRVQSLKAGGNTAGLLIEDASGERFMLKFDPFAYPELTTGAEAVSTHLMYALGYHVPDNDVVFFRPDRLLADSARVDPNHLQEVIEEAFTYEKGRLRALASRFVEGEVMGPWRYYGTVADDGNDIFPHERRRELRGLRVAAAWLENIDTRLRNTLASWIPSQDTTRGYVRHYLIDLGTTLGAGPREPLRPSGGHLRVYDLWNRLQRSPWDSVAPPPYRGLGSYEIEHFDPTTWKPNFPNPAFQRMDRADAFWVARRIASLDDADLRAAVAAGRYSDARTAEYLVRTLAARRDLIARTYLDLGGGLADFDVQDDALRWLDLAARHALAPDGRPLTVRWHVFDNVRGTLGESLAADTVHTGAGLPSADAAFLTAQFVTPGGESTRVYLRRDGERYEVAGLERCRNAASCLNLPRQLRELNRHLRSF